jgi:hypothetical protein
MSSSLSLGHNSTADPVRVFGINLTLVLNRVYFLLADFICLFGEGWERCPRSWDAKKNRGIRQEKYRYSPIVGPVATIYRSKSVHAGGMLTGIAEFTGKPKHHPPTLKEFHDRSYQTME